MTVEVNGIAHIQMTVNNAEACLSFWEKLCHFLEMKMLLRNDTTVYCIGSRTGILVREAPKKSKDKPFDQDTSGLHHFCFRACGNEDVDAIHEFVISELNANIIHSPEDGSQFAPGYYSFLFEDPDGIRVEVNPVPGKSNFGDKGRLGSEGAGSASRYGKSELNE